MRQRARQAYLFWEIRLREATMESTYTSATEGGICRMSTAHGTSNLHTRTGQEMLRPMAWRNLTGKKQFRV